MKLTETNYGAPAKQAVKGKVEGKRRRKTTLAQIQLLGLDLASLTTTTTTATTALAKVIPTTTEKRRLVWSI